MINIDPSSGNFTYSIDNNAPITITSTNFIILANSISPGNHMLYVNDNISTCYVGHPFTIGTAQQTSITLSMTGTYNDYNNDGFTNVGDVVNYQFTVNNPNNVAIDNVVVSNQQLIMNGSPITSLAAMSSDSTTFTGTYVLTQQDINLGTVFGSAVVTGSVNGLQLLNDAGLRTNLNISRGFKLNAFIDTNGNGIQDGAEVNFSSGNFAYQLNGAVAQNAYSYNGVFYLYESNPNNSYNFSIVLPNYNNLCGNGYVVTTSTYTNVTLSGTGITTYNFAITQGTCTDLSVYLQNFGGPRPGFVDSNYVYYSNNGNTTIPSGTITFTRDNALSIISTSPATTAIANGFNYNFTNLLPYETRYIYVNMQVPTIPTVSLGQLVANAVSISIPAGDINTANNSSTLTQDIRGAYDPNDKQESHGPQIVKSTFTANDYLTYKIQFENTGNENAINIKVNDVLSNLLDPTSIKMVDASHPYILDRVGNNLEWKFSGINLPPSVANTQIGHGYVVFQIKPMAGYAVGTTIPNTANIYFDFNPAIVTNTCTTEFVTTLSTNNFDFNDLKIYPNPINNILNIDNNEPIDQLEITNLLGQTIMTKSPNSLSYNLDLWNVATGVYFVKVFVGDNSQTVKVIKE
ncbi:MAG: T9SS type A sorting domain-containing protein [Flavobacterium sp.]|nr:T9SS type A sorting domain-containing protein [Flavobacterium sp.]